MNVTTYERGIQKGERDQAREALRDFLEMKFESEGTRFFNQLPSNLDTSKLVEIRKAIRSAPDIESLRRFIN